MPKTLKVLVVEGQEIFRAGMVAILSLERDIHLLGTADGADEALRLVEELYPDVVVVDQGLSGMSGIEMCEVLCRRHPGLAVLLLSACLDDHVVRMAVEAGARGFLSKDVRAQDLRRAIVGLGRGEAVLDPKITGRVMRWMRGALVLDRERALSERETEVLRLVARGATNTEIAARLHLSSHTVKTYLQRCLRKLDCHRRSEAAALASKWGLL